MADCIFCKIAGKEIPSEIVFEDENIFAFLDIKPVANGHTLVVSKKHSADFLATDDEVIGHLMPGVKRIGQAVVKALDAQGLNITTNVGAASGQSVFHLHFHLIPRVDRDGLNTWPHQDSDPKTRAEVAESIRKYL